jgi:K+ transporter
MIIWQWGRTSVRRKYQEKNNLTMQEIVNAKTQNLVQLPKNSIFMSPDSIKDITDKAPFILKTFYDRYQYLPVNMIILTIIETSEPTISEKNRFEIHTLFSDNEHGSIVSLGIKFGFLENPNVEDVLRKLATKSKIKLSKNPSDWLIHTIQERIILKHKTPFYKKALHYVYKYMENNTTTADVYFGLGKSIPLTVEDIPVWLN